MDGAGKGLTRYEHFLYQSGINYRWGNIDQQISPDNARQKHGGIRRE